MAARARPYNGGHLRDRVGGPAHVHGAVGRPWTWPERSATPARALPGETSTPSVAGGRLDGVDLRTRAARPGRRARDRDQPRASSRASSWEAVGLDSPVRWTSLFPGHRAVVQQQLKRRPVVDLPEQSRGAGALRHPLGSFVRKVSCRIWDRRPALSRPVAPSAPGDSGRISMPPLTDLAIANAATLKPLADVAAEMGIGEHLLEPYGANVAKIKLAAIEELADVPKAKYVVVTAITPTPLGEGKTTTTVGLGQAFRHIGRSATIAIRQPSMGPTFGIKGGAAGGGYSQVVPMEPLNLHLTGDFHAVTAAHNLLAAMVDNHLYQGNELGLDLSQHHLAPGARRQRPGAAQHRHRAGRRVDGVTRQTGFDITAASEVMATLALATLDGRPAARGCGASWSATPAGSRSPPRQLRRRRLDGRDHPRRDQAEPAADAREHSRARPRRPVRQHRHGNSSVVADLIGIRAGDYLITEAGFGADMGAERFFNIKCRTSGLSPRRRRGRRHRPGAQGALGQAPDRRRQALPEALLAENPDDVAAGAANLRKQIENIRIHGVLPVVAINAFPTDHPVEHAAIGEIADEAGARVAVCTHFSGRRRRRGRAGRGRGRGAPRSPASSGCSTPSAALGRRSRPSPPRLRRRRGRLRARPAAARPLRTHGFGDLPICMAKTHLSISSDPTLKGARPGGGCRSVRYAPQSGPASSTRCGEMRTMPGLGVRPGGREHRHRRRTARSSGSGDIAARSSGRRSARRCGSPGACSRRRGGGRPRRGAGCRPGVDGQPLLRDRSGATLSSDGPRPRSWPTPTRPRTRATSALPGRPAPRVTRPLPGPPWTRPPTCRWPCSPSLPRWPGSPSRWLPTGTSGCGATRRQRSSWRQVRARSQPCWCARTSAPATHGRCWPLRAPPRSGPWPCRFRVRPWRSQRRP